MSEINDDKVLSLINNEWNLYEFVRELIQALMPGKLFGGGSYSSYKKEEYRKEAKVVYFCIIFAVYCFFSSIYKPTNLTLLMYTQLQYLLE